MVAYLDSAMIIFPGEPGWMAADRLGHQCRSGAAHQRCREGTSCS